jgi:uncharacterized membrane protein YphA (DoxX/SURF4 family)
VNTASGIYVEITIKDQVDHIWQLTQDPTLHQRWDLRFSRIDYLPRPSPDQPQHFLYETRIGCGLSIRGTGESVGQHISPNGDATSALKFASSDPKSLIREGSGYWRYVRAEGGLRFLTWYDYTVRFGAAGRMADRIVFRPIMGWATAWSFDRLRLWAETGQPPESSLALALIHATARISIASIWIWQGLVPKLLYRQVDERVMLAQTGVSAALLPWIGGVEIVFGLLVLYGWAWRSIFPVNLALMVAAVVAVAWNSPLYLTAAFNPVTLNLAVIALSIVGWLSSATLPSARRCRRTAPEE